MKKIIIAIIAISTLLVVAFTGCTTSKSSADTTATGESGLLESTVTTVEKQTVSEIEPSIFLWIDESTSISAEEKQVLIQMTREYTGLKKVYGPYPFGGGAYGSETADGWTDLLEPLKASGHNSKVYIFTDGHQENPEGFNQRSFAGPYWGLEVHYVCLEKNGETEKLRRTLENSKEYFKGSTVIMEYIDGASRDVIIDEFEPETIQMTYEDKDTLFSLKSLTSLFSTSNSSSSKETKRSSWWSWLLPLLLLLLLLIPILWWLLRRKKDEKVSVTDKKEEIVAAGEPVASCGTPSVGATPTAGVSATSGTPAVARISPVSPASVTPVEEPESSMTIIKTPECGTRCCCCPYQKKNNTLAIVAIACVAIVAIAAVALVLATI